MEKMDTIHSVCCLWKKIKSFRFLLPPPLNTNRRHHLPLLYVDAGEEWETGTWGEKNEVVDVELQAERDSSLLQEITGRWRQGKAKKILARAFENQNRA